MKNVLFKLPNSVTIEDVIENMDYFKNQSQKITEIFEDDATIGRDLARELRKELELEYKNNDLVRTQKYYSDHKLFRVYKRAVQDAYVNVTGQLDKGRKTKSFLYDVYDYMTYYEHDLK